MWSHLPQLLSRTSAARTTVVTVSSHISLGAGSKHTLVKLNKDTLDAGVQLRTVKQCLDFATMLCTVLRLS